ncbi:MAG: sulfurtransferase [Gammaproteobacteria bacterium]|nr:sulfurtransferase [Gammaproteobacteria bacterium]
MYRHLIEIDGLARLGSTARLFDCRTVLGDPEAGRRAYDEGHIPGALHADLDRHLAGSPGSGGRHPLPERSALAGRFAAWGVNSGDQMVFYDDAGGAFAARGWWLARWCGHETVAILDGGLAAWPGDLTTRVEVPGRGNFALRPPLTRTVTAAEIGRDGDRFSLIDARTRRRFDGIEEPIDRVAGHIPGAHCRPFQENLDASGRFRDAAELRGRFAGLENNPVCYCGSGLTAAHNVLAMRLAGFDEPALYPGSWSEWIADPARPVAP